MRMLVLIVFLWAQPAAAYEFTCEQVIWAYRSFSEAHINRLAKLYGATVADRARAAKCREDAAKSREKK